MKSNLALYSFFAILFIAGISACCGNDDAPPIATIDFVIYDNTGEDNLFDEDGPYSIDSLQIYLEDGITLADYNAEPADGAIYLYRGGSESEELTYFLHIPNGEVDTLIGTFKFNESKCYSHWTFESLLFNGQSFTERDGIGYIKLLRD